MAKKSFSGGLNSLLGDKPKAEAAPVAVEPKEPKAEAAPVVAEPKEPKAEAAPVTAEPKAPKAPKKKIINSSEIGTKVNETRATFIVNKYLLEKMKAIAYWDRVPIKDIVNQALVEHIARHEKKNGEIKAMP